MSDGGDRQPCGACKHLRQECGLACIFAQFFPAHGANPETRFAKANETYSVEKMTTLIVALNSDSADSTIEARYDLLCQQFKFFHHLRLLRIEDNITTALQAAQASSSTASNESFNPENAIPEEERRQEADRLTILLGGGEELPPCVVCEQRGTTCGSGCVYAPYFPAADISAERNFARVEEKYGRSGLKDLIESLSMVAEDQPYLSRMLEFVEFMKQLYLENTDATGAEDKPETSLGASNNDENVNGNGKELEIERGFDLNKELPDLND